MDAFLKRAGRVLRAAADEALKPESFVKGEEFENYVRKYIFPLELYTLKHKTHGYTDNKNDYDDESREPDYIFISKKTKREFHLEVKFRSHFYDNAVKWCKGYQFKRYHEYDKECPVFILLGVEGTPENPENLFLFPLRKVKYTKLFRSILERYQIPLDKPYPESKLWKLI